MRNDQAEEVTRLVEQEREFQERMKVEAGKMATALIQSYLGPDHKVINIQSFHAGLTQALKDAREQGQTDRSADVLKL